MRLSEGLVLLPAVFFAKKQTENHVMTGNNNQENKTEALNEGEKKTGLSVEELEQVTGGDLPGVDSSNHVSSNGFEYTIPKPYIR